MLIGYRWKEYHKALGLGSIVDFSWETVQKEKPDLIHLLVNHPRPLTIILLTRTLCRTFLTMAKRAASSCCKERSQTTSTICTFWCLWTYTCNDVFPFLFLTSVRNHGGVPDIDVDLFRLEIGGLVKNQMSLSLKDLQDPEKFPYALAVRVASLFVLTDTRIVKQS